MDARTKGLILIGLVMILTGPLFGRNILISKRDNVRLYALLGRTHGIRMQLVALSGTVPENHIREAVQATQFSRYGHPGQKRVTISFEHAAAPLQKQVLVKVYPKDSFRNKAYRHLVTYRGVESLWRVAEWFTGNGANYRRIMRFNGMRSSTLKTGTWIRIPEELLRVDLHPQVLIPEQVLASGKREDLTYGSDDEGSYAVYRLRRGEALYSSVVVRFTGRLEAEAVHELVAVIVKRNRIRDVTDMPVGFPVKIPLEYVLPEYLPADSEAYREYREELRQAEAAARAMQIDRSEKLDGVYLILDAGHGGRDSGAHHNGAWEDDYMYDILCRVKRIIENETRGRVIPTIFDKSTRYTVFDKPALTNGQAEYLKTTPLYSLNSRWVNTTGVHLRWYFSNYQYRKLTAAGVPRSRIVFLSLHADALYYKVNGAMAYIPSASRGLYRTRITVSGSRYQKYLEYRDQPTYTFTKSEVTGSEGVSRKFARMLFEELKKSKIPVHREKPIRSAIYRSRRSRPFVPAVVKYNKSLVRILIEVGNLKNASDARNIRDPKFRERFARAVVNTLIRFYE